MRIREPNRIGLAQGGAFANLDRAFAAGDAVLGRGLFVAKFAIDEHAYGTAGLVVGSRDMIPMLGGELWLGLRPDELAAGL